MLVFLKSFFKREWCAHVIEAPEEIKIMVFNRGTLIGLNLLIETGGQDCPSSTLGLREKAKNLQKKDKKNIISEVINKIIPIFKPFKTSLKCSPCKFTSRLTSFHHENAIKNVIIFRVKNKKEKLVYNCSFKIRAKNNAEIEQVMGQGLKDTMWKGWNFFDIKSLLKV